MGHSRIARIKEISEFHSVTISKVKLLILFYIPNRLRKCYYSYYIAEINLFKPPSFIHFSIK